MDMKFCQVCFCSFIFIWN